MGWCARKRLSARRWGWQSGTRGAMDRFVSHYTLRLDAKGRVSIPAPFRAVLARDGFDGLYCYPALDRPALDAGGNALLAEIEALIARYPPYSDEREQLLGRALRHERDPQDRRRGQGGPLRRAEDACRHRGRGRLRRASATNFRSGSPDASARNSRRPPRRSARSRSNWAPGWRRRVRTEHGNDGGQRQRHRCRWRTGPSHSRARPPRGRVSRRRATAASIIDAHVRRRRVYARAFSMPRHCSVIGIDRDRSAIARGAELVEAAGGRLMLVEDRFSNLASRRAQPRPRSGRRRRVRSRRVVDAAR